VREGLERDQSLPEPQHRFLTTGRPEEFQKLGHRFLGPEIETVDQFSWVTV
ncbi:MAG: glutamate racemase, partial [Nocardioidaceae bacterium]|nr:glutamate racemase [Nocardioidaceae bacterium]